MARGKNMTEGNAQDEGVRRMSRLRIAAWVGAAFVLLVPVVVGAPWSGGDYIFAGILLFGSLAAYEIAARTRNEVAYRGGVGLAIAAAFLLVWVNAAVGITDGDADGMYLVVIAVGITGTLVAQFKPKGMAFAMLATAVSMALVSTAALIAGLVPEFNSAFEIIGITAFFVVLFSGSAVLFRESASRGATDA